MDTVEIAEMPELFGCLLLRAFEIAPVGRTATRQHLKPLEPLIPARPN